LPARHHLRPDRVVGPRKLLGRLQEPGVAPDRVLRSVLRGSIEERVRVDDPADRVEDDDGDLALLDGPRQAEDLLGRKPPFDDEGDDVSLPYGGDED